MMRSINQNCGSCNRPQPLCKCGNPHITDNCTTANQPKYKPVKIAEYECGKVYGELECIVLPNTDNYYVSLFSDNDTEPAVGKRLNPPTWAGPYTLCGLINYFAKNKVGPQGAQGSTGSQGRQGERGETGLQGRQGERGETGLQGAEGAQGRDGEQGLQGVAGIQGQEGIQGPAGIDGLQGVSGGEGTQGRDGRDGVQGGTGIQGNEGSQGSTGATGAQGAQGVQGAPYTPNVTIDNIANFVGCPQSGSITIWDLSTNLVHRCVNGVMLAETFQFGVGVQGAQGAQGSTGATGTQGRQGEQGLQGRQGNDGRDGLQGARGEKGAQGATGAQGVEGRQGVQGEQGTQGQRGVQGARGVDGAQGAKGERGLQGADGKEGSQGAQGAQGERGEQGLQGAFGGPQGEKGEKGDKGDKGDKGEPGKDYDPNCTPPIVTSIACADVRGNISLIFDENPDTTKLVHFSDFVPTAYAVANKKTDSAGNVFTVNPNGSVVHWFAQPSTKVIVTNFEPQGLYDDRNQLITFDVNSTSTSACIGKGEWLLKLDCNNCPCTVPTFVRNKDGSITINDGYGLVFTIRPDGCGGLMTLPTELPCSTEPPVNPEDTTVCGIEEMQGAMLKVRQWQKCNTGVPVGIYFYNGMLYINTKDGNTKSPTAKNSDWLGGYDLYELMQAMIEMFAKAVVDRELNSRLTAEVKKQLSIELPKQVKVEVDKQMAHLQSQVETGFTLLTDKLTAKLNAQLKAFADCAGLSEQCCNNIGI